MRQIISITLCLLILVSSLGVSMEVSYCPMKKQTSYSIGSKATCCCKKPGSKKNKCCNNKIVRLGKVSDYKASDLVKIKLATLYDAPEPALVFENKCTTHTASQLVKLPVPEPPDKHWERLILYQQFLI